MTHLALFDLDHTLLAGDSDYLWGRFLVERGLVDADAYERQNQIFYDQYRAGTLDIESFCQFSFAPLAAHPLERLLEWRQAFVAEKILPAIAPMARALLQHHRDRGEHLAIVTATNRFITEPVAAHLNVETLIATEPEFIDGRFTGRLAGVASFRQGKVQRLEQWLSATGLQVGHIRFYSDSHNDLPLLERADRAIAVDPDDTLRAIARRRRWPIISLYGPTLEIPAELEA